ncbi:MAG: ABC transporter ATP-binding protein/permease [Clostridia bacterium]|nr:ABC transporter ATP-binding protein/permease [Clostridia bacterium]
MLKLENIVKIYSTGGETVRALDSMSVAFRENEFVSILGPSGCGKTTLLNIIGGLDRYTEGDLKVSGRSTEKFTDTDWDIYRNTTIGFVFQQYNLIPHQTVLANVELALTLSGVSKSERKRRAVEALEKVGLGDQLKKKPNQLSGGQAQRVAIARSLVNNPKILLADEPTGALDTETGKAVMDILREVAKDRLVIMVTHNPDLANEYSTRIINLLDGRIISDSDPYDGGIPEPENKTKKKKKISMSLFTALSLSLTNLMTKKGRTILTAFAGSIGIIGIALIMSMSNGVQNYIDGVEKDTLSNYPVQITETTMDISAFFKASQDIREGSTKHPDNEDKVYSNPIMFTMLNSMTSEMQSNDMGAFKKYIESDECDIGKYAGDIQYMYSTTLNAYRSDIENGICKVNPSTVFDDMGMMNQVMAESNSMISGMSDANIWNLLNSNEEIVKAQYEVLSGRFPEKADEVVMIVTENNEISDYTLYTLGMLDRSDIPKMMEKLMSGEVVETADSEYSYDDILSLKFRIVADSDYYAEENGVWADKREDEEYMKTLLEDAYEVSVVGIIKTTDKSLSAAQGGGIGYTAELVDYLIDRVNDSEVVALQKNDPDTDVLTGLPFMSEDAKADASASSANAGMDIDYSSLSPEELAALSAQAETLDQTPSGFSKSTYQNNLRLLGCTDRDHPSVINIYPKDFEAKEEIIEIIKKYNQEMSDKGEDDKVINYTDYIGMLISSITTIVNVISYVLIAFVAISLIVSSIMIGIITYISVLERTKEIGILRSIGASKKDISRVFNAETIIIGFVAGLIGIGITLLLLIPINAIIYSLSDIENIAALPTIGGIILVVISVLLTLIAGIIPSRVAANKDPVIALRTE